MKSLIPIIALLSSPPVVSLAQGAQVPPALMNIPGDGLRLKGESVQATPTPEFIQLQQALSQKLANLPAERRQEFFSNYNATELLKYTPELWDNKEAYNRYREEWKKITISPIQTIQLGAYERGNGEWGLHGVSVNAFTHSVTPLAVSGMVYNSSKNTWTTGNGELLPQELATGRDNMYGACKGTTWKLEKKDAMSDLLETLSISRRTNGEYLYLSYSFRETTPDGGTTLAQGSYVLRFRVGNPAPEPEEDLEEATPVAGAIPQQAEEKPAPKARDKAEKRSGKKRHRRRRNRRH